VVPSVAKTSSPFSKTFYAAVYTAHSIPLSMTANCRYEEQLAETARRVLRRFHVAHP
jgi:protoheme ferro-lyase